VKAARLAGKPVVVDFIGYATSTRQVDDVYFATTFDETAQLAVNLAGLAPESDPVKDTDPKEFAPGQRYLRGLFSGGTLAYEAMLILQRYLPAVYSNAPLDKKYRLEDSLVSQDHTVIDLGEDEFTVGRLHPMLDNDLRIRRLEAEASDPEVAVILLDVVLGYGAHPDPAGELAPAIARAHKLAEDAGRHLEVVAILSGTDEDPQDFNSQVEQLESAGALVETSNDKAVRYVGRLLQSLDPDAAPGAEEPLKAVDVQMLDQPLAAINVGLESFTESLGDQGAQALQVDWRPPAGGDVKLMAILERLKSKG